MVTCEKSEISLKELSLAVSTGFPQRENTRGILESFFFPRHCKIKLICLINLVTERLLCVTQRPFAEDKHWYPLLFALLEILTEFLFFSVFDFCWCCVQSCQCIISIHKFQRDLAIPVTR